MRGLAEDRRGLAEDRPLASSASASIDAGTPVPLSIWRRVRHDAILLGAGGIGVVIAQLGFRSILIAVLVPAAYGRLALILSIYNTVWIIGASGLPNTVASHIARTAPGQDAAIIRSGVRAALWPTVVATIVIATTSGLILDSPLACLLAAIGLPCLVYSLLSMGILRGRGRVGAAASIMPTAALAEVAPLAICWLAGLGVTPVSAFAIFCFGNVAGLATGVCLLLRTAPKLRPAIAHPTLGPTPRQLLGSSMWLAAATIAVSGLPLIMRSAAALDSYGAVAITDVALVLLSIPQRVGAVLVQAVVPHATRAAARGDGTLAISRREHMWLLMPFALTAAVVGFTPVVRSLFDLVGRPEYGAMSKYLALALLAGPARILYGLVEGVLIANGEGKFLALTATSITVAASVVIFAAAALGSTMLGFAVFVIAIWMVYLIGLKRCSAA